MSIEVEILVEGLTDLAQMAEAFKLLSKNISDTDLVKRKATDTDNRFNKTTRKLADAFKTQAEVMGMSVEGLLEYIEGCKAAASASAKFEATISTLSKPFTKIKADLNSLTATTKVFNKGMLETSKITSGQLNDRLYMGMIKNTKAALLTQKKLNSEIEKQAELTAKLAMLDPSKIRNASLKAEVANLKLAQVETEKLQAKLNAVSGPGSAVAKPIITSKEYDRSVVALKKLRTNLNSLPSGKLVELKKAAQLLEAELIKTGVVSKEIRSEITALEGQYTKAMAKMTTSSNRLKYALGGVARSLGAMTYSYASLAPLLAGIAVGTAIKQVYALGTAFEYTTKYIESLNDAASDLSALDIQKKLLSFEGSRTGPQERAEGMKELAKAGVSVEESLREIGELSKFATVAEIDLGTAVGLVVGQSRAFNQEFSTTANMIASAALSSATSIEKMAVSLSYTTSLASVSKIKFDEIATALALMANSGVSSSKAGTALTNAILKMQNPTDKLKGMFKGLNIQWSAFTEGGQVKNLKVMVSELAKVTKGLPDKERIELMKELFGLRAIKAGAVLLKETNSWDKFNSTIRNSAEGMTFVDQKYKDLMDTVKGRLDVLGAQFESTLGKAFIDSGSAEKMKEVLDSLTETVASDNFQKNLTSVVESLSSLAVGAAKLVSIVGTMDPKLVEAGVIGFLLFGTSPIGRVLAGAYEATVILGKLKKIAEDGPERSPIETLLSGGTADQKLLIGEEENKTQVSGDRYGLDALSKDFTKYKRGFQAVIAAMTQDTKTLKKIAKETAEEMGSVDLIKAKVEKVEFEGAAAAIQTELVNLQAEIAKAQAEGGNTIVLKAELALVEFDEQLRVLQEKVNAGKAVMLPDQVAQRRAELEQEKINAMRHRFTPGGDRDKDPSGSAMDKYKERVRLLGVEYKKLEDITTRGEVQRKITPDNASLQRLKQQKTLLLETGKALAFTGANFAAQDDEKAAQKLKTASDKNAAALRKNSLDQLKVRQKMNDTALKLAGDIQSSEIGLAETGFTKRLKLNEIFFAQKSALASKDAATQEGILKQQALAEKVIRKDMSDAEKDLQFENQQLRLKNSDKTYEASVASLDRELEKFRETHAGMDNLDSLSAENRKLHMDELGEKSYETASIMKDAFTSWTEGFASDMNDMLWGGELTFASIAESFGQMITEMLIQILILDKAKKSIESLFSQDQMGGLLNSLFSGAASSGVSGITSSIPSSTGLMMSAQGNVFSGPGISSYSNSVVSQPTLFPFAKGTGLMGEAGSEAIMPLTRTSSGNLGVEAVGGGRSITNVTINNNAAGTTTTTEEKENSSGGLDILVEIDKITAANMSKNSSATRKTMGAMTGSSTPMLRR